MNDTQKQSFFNAITTLVIALMAVLSVIFGTRAPEIAPNSNVAPQAITYNTVLQTLPGISATNGTLTYTSGSESSMETGLYDYVRVHTIVTSSNAASATNIVYQWSSDTSANCVNNPNWATNASMSYNGVSNTIVANGSITDVRVLPVQGFCLRAAISTLAGNVTPTIYLQLVKVNQ